ncbi:MAG: phage portal protein [Desulfobulbaceae bacterium]|nr:phage portal protein [Desulfobulbaceae bacterium]
MNFIDRAIQYVAEKRGVFVQPNADYIPDISAITAAGVSVNHKNALTFTGAFSAISTKAENMASLPKAVFKTTKTGKETDKKHPVYSLIHYQPNPMMTDFAFWEKVEADVAGWGNSVAVIEFSNKGYPKNLWPVDADNYQIIKSNRELFYKVNSGDFAGTYPSSEILHFKYFSKDGINGIDPISLAAEAIGIGIGGQQFAADYFATKGKMRGVFEMDNELGEKEYKQWNKRMARTKDHATPLLEYGIKYKGISVSPDAAQAIQSRIFSIQDASRIWKVPVSLLAEHSHSTFSNTEQQDIQFVKYGLRPECKRFETELETKLFTGDERDVYEVKFNLEGLLRGDAKTRALVNHYAILDGYKTRNEIRLMDNLNPAPGLDEFLVPLNMTTPEALQNAIKDENNK